MVKCNCYYFSNFVYHCDKSNFEIFDCHMLPSVQKCGSHIYSLLIDVAHYRKSVANVYELKILFSNYGHEKKEYRTRVQGVLDTDIPPSFKCQWLSASKISCKHIYKVANQNNTVLRCLEHSILLSFGNGRVGAPILLLRY